MTRLRKNSEQEAEVKHAQCNFGLLKSVLIDLLTDGTETLTRNKKHK